MPDKPESQTTLATPTQYNKRSAKVVQCKMTADNKIVLSHSKKPLTFSLVKEDALPLTNGML